MKILNSTIVLLLLFGACSPQKNNEEQSESTTSQTSWKRTSIAEIEEGIKAYIDRETSANGGYFLVNDEKRQLRLKLVRVHTEYLSNLGPDRHFACVDLADEEGDVYDVDFFLEGKPGEMLVTETSLHKLNGKPFYTWKQVVDKTWRRVPVEEATTELLGVIEGDDKFEFRYEAIVPDIKEQAKVWIPLAKTDNFQTVSIVSMDYPGVHKILKEKEFGNDILYLELDAEHSGEKIEVIYEVSRKEKSPYDSELEIDPRYLQPNLLMPIGGRFSEIAAEAIKGKEKEGKLMQARALYDYIIDNMRYMKFGEYGTGNSVLACDSKTGNCTEFHSLFISLARSIEIPARFSIGASIPSDRNEGGIDGYHCWAEFYADGKWWPVDISEGNKYTALATYYFGRHPANRIELSQGRDLVVEPSPSGGPINFLAYPIMETEEGEVYPKTSFSFVRKN
ncbi:Transglutaminase-like enzyme, putative cysteine protease [Indibacter alkaliphilus LW1]|uniref:Transglutaminase-like enzyme, putative cysteine protease n=1 Tax=Indibacter alkaliphilus (strain CCUG 57479 / KCTC 22604 / LW1) TaxID=1189612 RepID=S2D814_INDAL|nr:transglutaminase-like domain-containing protein [Indibacter alkaliphilus]EOZ93200.1 Transglutaminase-like enzyme, putative cysteine protease [Indibacter alkaliphilus LW1]